MGLATKHPSRFAQAPTKNAWAVAAKDEHGHLYNRHQPFQGSILSHPPDDDERKVLAIVEGFRARLYSQHEFYETVNLSKLRAATVHGPYEPFRIHLTGLMYHSYSGQPHGTCTSC